LVFLSEKSNPKKLATMLLLKLMNPIPGRMKPLNPDSSGTGSRAVAKSAATSKTMIEAIIARKTIFFIGFSFSSLELIEFLAKREIQEILIAEMGEHATLF
jgi:hypothetical protein